MTIRLAVIGLTLASSVLACAPEAEPEPNLDPPDPEVLFAGLEARLVDADAVEMEFEITADGAITVDLAGRFKVWSDSVILAATGTFAGQEADLLLEAGSDEMGFGNGPQRTTAPTPEYLHEALFIGLTRMGILHNLARLTAGAPPDRAEGGVKDWVVVDELSLGTTGGPGGVGRSISFNLTVSGTPSGSAVLDIDDQTTPLERRQVVVFPEGEMRVIERYTRVVIHP